MYVQRNISLDKMFRTNQEDYTLFDTPCVCLGRLYVFYHEVYTPKISITLHNLKRY